MSEPNETFIRIRNNIVNHLKDEKKFPNQQEVVKCGDKDMTVAEVIVALANHDVFENGFLENAADVVLPRMSEEEKNPKPTE